MNLTNLPSMEYSFDLKVKGKNTGYLYEGNFVYKRLNYFAKNEAAKYTTQISGDLTNLDLNIQNINFILGILRLGLTEFPEWWEDSNFGLDLYDDNIISKIYDKINKFEKKWHDEVWAKEPQKPKIKDEKTPKE